MTDVTKPGRELYERVQRRLVETDWEGRQAARETCSLIARHTVTYNRIQESWCNDEMSNRLIAYWEHRERKLETRIRSLASKLITPTGPMEVSFEGDPRYTVVSLHEPGTIDHYQGVSVG